MHEACHSSLSVHIKNMTSPTSGRTSLEETFSDLVAEHQSMVINTCYRFVLNKEDAEDIAQEVFIEAYRSLENFRGDAKISTWLYRIAVTKSLDFLRRKKRKKRFSSLKRVIGRNDPIQEISLPDHDTPDETMLEQERLTVLENALENLPDNQKTAFLLSKYDGYGNQEIAEIMATTVPAVESLIHRAKKNLQKKLEKHYRNR
ncbi:MAG TPA: RNA polymerase sigma factor [Prosthecochloris aestuarii]|uniref:RNA polymerase sigma factor n=1 Tax=Prosthecochloris aestuarii TaxID=1102 RepID=A0A831SR61_PROAE|nr:RNA polymerase sigma factor [Prosthecochloris aestuarii]